MKTQKSLKIKTYILNLKDAVERREYLLNEVSKYPFMDVELIEAVNGKQMTEEEVRQRFDVKKFVYRYSRTPLAGEIGCVLSHRKCYEHLLSTNDPYALILEDDVSFTRPEDTEYLIAQGIKMLEEKETDIVLFSSKTVLFNRPRKIDQTYTVYPVYNAYGTHAYMVNRRIAKRLLEDSKPFMVADDFFLINQKGIRIKTFYPNTLIPNVKFELVGKSQIVSEVRSKICYDYIQPPFIYRLRAFIRAHFERFAAKRGWLLFKNFP